MTTIDTPRLVDSDEIAHNCDNRLDEISSIANISLPRGLE